MKEFEDPTRRWNLDYSFWINWVECEVVKKSGKPFKSGKKIGLVKELTINPNSNKHAFLMDDGSIVDCHIVINKNDKF